MPKLALVRHGQSAWNLENRFTGWWDADLTEKGEDEARKAGHLLKASGADFRAGFTSVQTRAIRTMWLALTEMGRAWLPIEKHWRLNERHYGGLTGLDKAETAAKHGDDQVHIWRRSYDIPPPPLEAGSEYDLSADPRYDGIDVPATESLKLTLERVLPCWKATIAPVLENGTDVVIAAHGNSLRALVKHLFDVPDETITGVEIPTGNPLLIDLDAALKPVPFATLMLSGQQSCRICRETIPQAAGSATHGTALALAHLNHGLTGNNPSVGCVIVDTYGHVVAEGITGQGGRPHAEEIALEAAGAAARGATAYVTLEPCRERSAGGVSCSRKLAEAGIVRVVCAISDPHPIARGGLEVLSEAGVQVELGLCKESAGQLYRSFFSRIG